MGIINIMILILLFKACWYNHYLKEILAAGRPYDKCPKGTNAGHVLANTALYKKWYTEYAIPAYGRFFNNYTTKYDGVNECPAGVKGATGAIPIFDAATYGTFKTSLDTYLKTNTNCKASLADWETLGNFCLRGVDDAFTADQCTGYINKNFFSQNHKDSDYQTTITGGSWKYEEYHWTDVNQLMCSDIYNLEYYKWKERVCVLTRRLFELIAGYGLGGSSVALFGRVGGGIYTKAADVGADLVGKTIKDLKEDDITNPGTIADNVGDNVGDIAGMGSDLFGSLAESSCAALVVSATSYQLVETPNALFFPVCITASGAVASWLTVLLIHVRTVTMKNVQSVLKTQIGMSTVLMTGCILPSIFLLPKHFTFEGGAEKIPIKVDRWVAYGCVMFGLWSGMIIGFITEYYTNNAYSPTLWLADACDKGPAPNIILGLALGYVSVVVPITCITATIGFAFATCGMYGIGLSALGMLGSLPCALSVDGFGPISDNAGGVAEMSGLPGEIRDLTDSLDAAGNTTAAVGKGFAIGSACLVGLALFGAFITRIGDTSVDILKPV